MKSVKPYWGATHEKTSVFNLDQMRDEKEREDSNINHFNDECIQHFDWEQKSVS